MITYAPATQLMLFDDAPADENFECTFSWADGDSDPAQLERLASLLKGRRQVLGRPGVSSQLVRVLHTRIEDGKVIATCREETELMRKLGMRDVLAFVEEEADEE